MSEPKFTPGPWVIIPAREYDGDDDALFGSYTSPAGIEGGDGNPVCVFGTCEGSGTLFENASDYNLIAAAPDLYAALIAAKQELWDRDRRTWNLADWKNFAAVQRIDAALAKARGQAE